MKVVYMGRSDAVMVGGVVADRGVEVDLPAELAKDLCATGVWSKAPTPDKGNDKAEEAGS